MNIGIGSGQQQNIGFDASFALYNPTQNQAKRLMRKYDEVARQFPGSEVSHFFKHDEKLPSNRSKLVVYARGICDAAEEAFAKIFNPILEAQRKRRKGTNNNNVLSASVMKNPNNRAVIDDSRTRYEAIRDGSKLYAFVKRQGNEVRSNFK